MVILQGDILVQKSHISVMSKTHQFWIMFV
jgi:hypothetical protein